MAILSSSLYWRRDSKTLKKWGNEWGCVKGFGYMGKGKGGERGGGE